MNPIVEPSFRGKRRLIFIPVVVVAALALLLVDNVWVTTAAGLVVVAYMAWETLHSRT